MESITLIDGNNFYASCEQSINPSLRKKPLVILSNNDGCIIARSPEARALRIKMGEPYFKVKDKLHHLGVVVLSSNYSLYGDMSKRLMNLLNQKCEKIEIYSIDEAFGLITRPKDENLYPWARSLRALVYQNLGITISIGIGENKVRAKLANKLAKRFNYSAGIFDITNVENQSRYLKKIKIESIWGVGHQTSKWLYSKGIKNAEEFKDMNEYEIKKKLGVVGQRIQLELKGCVCLPIEEVQNSKKEIRVSRSFGKSIKTLEDLTQALIIYTIRAAEKMRSGNLQTSLITVFTRTSYYSDLNYKKSAHKKLIESTNNTITLIKIVIELAKKIYHPGYKLAKAGVLMKDLTSSNYLQKTIDNIQFEEQFKKEESLIKTIDSINKKFKHKVISWGIENKGSEWRMNRNLLSDASTTDIKKIPTIII